MVPRSLGEDFATLDPTGPEYLGRLIRFARNQPTVLEGLYLVAGRAGRRGSTRSSVVRDIVAALRGGRRAPGLHPLPDRRVRLQPRDAGGVSPFDHSRSRATPIAGATRHAREAEPLLYTRAFPERWRAFRVDRLTDLLTQLRETVRAARPGAVVSAAVAPDPVEAAGQRLQDWPAWLAKGLIDVVCPMASTTDSAAFAVADRGGARGRGTPSAVGGHRRVLALARADHGRHPGGAADWRGRRRPVLLRQPHRPGARLRISQPARQGGVQLLGSRLRVKGSGFEVHDVHGSLL